MHVRSWLYLISAQKICQCLLNQGLVLDIIESWTLWFNPPRGLKWRLPYMEDFLLRMLRLVGSRLHKWLPAVTGHRSSQVILGVPNTLPHYLTYSSKEDKVGNNHTIERHALDIHRVRIKGYSPFTSSAAVSCPLLLPKPRLSCQEQPVIWQPQRSQESECPCIHQMSGSVWIMLLGRLGSCLISI